MQQNTFDEKLYTSTEVAEILGVSWRSIYRYLDENKIQAEVRTATGRHRFTRQNINDFLHPGKQVSQAQVSKSTSLDDNFSREASGDNAGQENSEIILKQSKDIKEDAIGSEWETKEAKEVKGEREHRIDKQDADTGVQHAEPEAEEIKDEPIDWLARFRQAAEKYKTQVPESSDSRETPKTVTRKTAKIAEEEQEIVEEPVSEEPIFNYYRSGVGGLKEIAQSLDKSAKNASLDYAFTMSAGLSLHKPIKPFSLIHSYIRGSDLPYFEKVLQLTSSQKDTAQLCLIASDDANLYAKRRELHGLYVVSDSQIKADLLADGEVELASELD